MIPKPEKRGRKPRKPIRAKGRKGSHTSRHRKKQMSLKNQCAYLWAQWVKRGQRCEFLGTIQNGKVHTQCGGPLQAMHGFGKKAYPAVRYAAWNGFCGCAAVHSYYTWRSPEWENFLRSKWGEELYQSRLREAQAVRKYDLEQVAQTYRAALSAEGV